VVIIENLLLNLLHFDGKVKAQISSCLSVTRDSDGRFQAPTNGFSSASGNLLRKTPKGKGQDSELA
jgi:hypothetical protein